MTEKRYTIEESENQLTIYDNEGLDDYYHLGNDTEDVKSICKRLNEQDQKIKELKQAYNDAKSDVEKHERIIKDMMKDNLLI